MSAPTRIRREYSNCRFYFIPQGESVDSPAVTVSKSTWPDANPTSNWTPYQILDIEKCVPSHSVEEEVFKVPADSGGYDLDTEEQVTKRMWEMSTSKGNNYFKRLEHALASNVVVDAPQTPGTKNDNFIVGVGLAEFQNKDGSIIERWQLWGKLRLKGVPAVEPKTRLWTFTFEQMASLLNTYVLK